MSAEGPLFSETRISRFAARPSANSINALGRLLKGFKLRVLGFKLALLPDWAEKTGHSLPPHVHYTKLNREH